MDINLTLLAQAAVFAIFIWVTARWPWRWLMEMIDERNKNIADGLAAAERGTRSLQEASAKSDEALKAARSQAQEIISAASKQATQMVDQAKASAKTEGDRIVAHAREDVSREMARAKEELRKSVGELAVQGATRILKREIDAKAHADVLKELAARV